MNDFATPVFLSEEECLGLRRGYLVTVNIQHIYEARGSERASRALFGNDGAHHCIDGRGAAALFGRTHSQRPLPLVQGNALLERWLAGAETARLLVIGSSTATVRHVMERYPGVEAVVDDRIVRIGSPDEAERCAGDIASAYPGPWDLVAIALGVPKQEELANALHPLLDAPIFCIGGSFEILANAFPRSPSWIQAIGLEGMWRLALEPSRKRIERLFRTYWTFAHLYFRRASVEQLMGRS